MHIIESGLLIDNLKLTSYCWIILHYYRFSIKSITSKTDVWENYSEI